MTNKNHPQLETAEGDFYVWTMEIEKGSLLFGHRRRMAEILSVHPIEGSVAGETTQLCDLGDGVVSAVQQLIGQRHSLVFNVCCDRDIGDQRERLAHLGD